MNITVINEVMAIPLFNQDPLSYFTSGMIFLVTLLLAWLLTFIFKNYLESIAKRTKTDLDDIILEKIKRPFFYLILAQGLKLSLYNLQVSGFIEQGVSSIMALVLVLVLSRTTEVLLVAWARTFSYRSKTQIDEVLLPVFKKFVKLIFILIGLMWLLSIWGVDVSPYLAGVGISGLVLGLALQDSLKNILGGVSLILDRAYKIGDMVELEDGRTGIIADVGLRSTKLRTWDNDIVTIPNSYLAESKVLNYTQPSGKCRITVPFTVAYGTDTDFVKKVILNELKKIPSDVKEHTVNFVNMGDFSLDFKAYVWVRSWKDRYETKLKIIDIVHKRLNKEGISIPFPTTTVELKK